MGFPGQFVKNKLEFQWKNSRLMGIFEVVAGCGWWLRGWTAEVWRQSISRHVFPLKATPPLLLSVDVFGLVNISDTGMQGVKKSMLD